MITAETGGKEPGNLLSLSLMFEIVFSKNIFKYVAIFSVAGLIPLPSLLCNRTAILFPQSTFLCGSAVPEASRFLPSANLRKDHMGPSSQSGMRGSLLKGFWKRFHLLKRNIEESIDLPLLLNPITHACGSKNPSAIL